MSYFLTGLVTRARFPSQTELFKKNWNGRGIANWRGIFYLISLRIRGFFNDYKIYFNSVVIWSQFAIVSLLLRTKNELFPRTSYMKGLHVRNKFLPVPDNRRTLDRQTERSNWATKLLTGRLNEGQTELLITRLQKKWAKIELNKTVTSFCTARTCFKKFTFFFNSCES